MISTIQRLILTESKRNSSNICSEQQSSENWRKIFEIQRFHSCGDFWASVARRVFQATRKITSTRAATRLRGQHERVFI